MLGTGTKDGLKTANLCDYFIIIHGHHKIDGIRDASVPINLRSPKFIGSSFNIRHHYQFAYP